VPTLSADHADAVYFRLTGKHRGGPSGRTATLGEVYALAHAEGWSKENSGIESYRDIDENESEEVAIVGTSTRPLLSARDGG
jgi:hypothetical protein